MLKCSVDDCDVKHYSLGYCRKHYRQILDYGEIRHRTIRDPNIFEESDGVIKIHMFDRKCNPTEIVVVDILSMDLVTPYKWCLRFNADRPYSCAFINGKTQQLHRYLLGVTDDKVYVDHINRNVLDCRLSNLRIADAFQSKWNTSSSKGTSKYKGVWWDKREMAWRAHITFKGKRIPIGLFNQEIEAAKAYDRKAKQLQGEYANLNIVTELGDK